MIPYGKQFVQEDDIQAVIEVLRSDWLTTGPKVTEFEKLVAEYVEAKHAVAVSSGTAALHCAMYAAGVSPGDEVIAPPITFAATTNAVIYQGGTPVFVDVDPNTLLLDPVKVEEKISCKTKAIIAVDYTGHPCNYDALKRIADRHGIFLIADACHSLGAKFKGKKAGTLADMTVFSFHPVKHITTGEGGMIVTSNLALAKRIQQFRNHGIDSDYRQREREGSWYYHMVDLGYNYRISDIQCALGITQLKKLPAFLKRRREIAGYYDKCLLGMKSIRPLSVSNDVTHAYHLYVVRIDFKSLGKQRTTLFQQLREKEIGVNVHYIPVHLHPYYRRKLGTGRGLCPIAETAYEEIISLPIFPALDENKMNQCIDALILSCA
ncbi:Aminotransferase, DegT/DnrJ/EryC1/StrS family [Olavius sp. associated proteobacterium Delta 1]|nr:Aminotransferase, DegT/DnrJ/EryC1/StrS family [Olavius sp. associated proteobacterium Delta 1]